MPRLPDFRIGPADIAAGAGGRSSGSTQVAVLGMRGQLMPERPASLVGERPHAIRLIAFAALGLYGITRWSKLLTGGTHGRLIAILALALLLAGARPTIARAS